MDFLNKLGKKASETYQITKEKTTKISGELKLRNKINECKNKISDLYEEIGKVVYAEYKSGTVEEDTRKEKCAEIDALNAEIEKAETEILALKNMKKCIACGEDIALNVEFCPKCGKEQPKVEKVEVVESAPEEATEVKAEENTENNND